jgi:hypothetical protein
VPYSGPLPKAPRSGAQTLDFRGLQALSLFSSCHCFGSEKNSIFANRNNDFLSVSEGILSVGKHRNNDRNNDVAPLSRLRLQGFLITL